MLDLKFVRDNLAVVEQALKNRNASVDLSEFIGLDKKRRELLVEVEALKSRRNTVSQEVSRLKKEKQDAEIQLQREKMAAEMELKRQEAALRTEERRAQMAIQAKQAEKASTQPQPGASQPKPAQGE